MQPEFIIVNPIIVTNLRHCVLFNFIISAYSSGIYSIVWHKLNNVCYFNILYKNVMVKYIMSVKNN
jgi:hypothetical protein